MNQLKSLLVADGKISKIYLDDATALVGWIADSNIVYTYSKGFTSGDKYRQASLKIIEIARAHKSRKVLYNITNMQVVPLEDQKWVIDVFVPLLIKENILHSASVLPENIFAKLSLQRLNQNTDEEFKSLITSKEFSNELEAYNWLKSLG